MLQDSFPYVKLEQVTLPFIFKREVGWVKTTDPIMQSNFLALIKKKKGLHKEMFHLPEMFLISKEVHDQGHCKVPFHQIWPEKNYVLSTPVLHCAWGVKWENAKQTAGG